MAQSRNNLLIRDASGQIGRQLVLKRYGNKTVIAKYPDMSHIKPTRLQKTNRRNFAAAVAYARDINNDPVKKALYTKKVKKGQRVYNYAIKEYMYKNGG